MRADRPSLDRDAKYRRKSIPGGTTERAQWGEWGEANSKDQSDQNTEECQGGVGHNYLESSILYLLHKWGINRLLTVYVAF